MTTFFLGAKNSNIVLKALLFRCCDTASTAIGGSGDAHHDTGGVQRRVSHGVWCYAAHH
jgi:hypothetical protein